jgi:Flp pilus assembly protein TadD
MLTTQQRAAYDKAVQELVDAEMISADRPETHLNLGLLAMRRQRPDAAGAEYNTALRLDPKFVPALVNLADLDRARGDDAKGVTLLRQATALEPGNADAHHALGLALVRQRNLPVALDELRKAMDLAPNSARYGYVYAIALNSTGGRGEAMAQLRRLHGRFPADADVTSALLSLSLEGGDQVSALRYARDLLRLRPGDAQVTALIRQLQR